MEQLKLARSRLRLGIANVGFWVMAASGGLCWLVGGGAHGLEPRTGGLILLAVLVVQAAFDVMGGAWLMPSPAPKPRAFLLRWLRGILSHSLVLGVVGGLSYASFQISSGFALAVVIAMSGLALGRQLIFQAMAGATLSKLSHGRRNDLVAAVSDPAFTGGIVGFGSRARRLWPARWLEVLPKSELAVESRRREWQMTQRLNNRAFLALVGWNLAGTSLGTFVFALADRPPLEALLGHACWMTLWAFASLLILPAMSRGTVLAADRAAAEDGLEVAPWITRFPELTGEDGSASSAVQTIFYPIPSTKTRLRFTDNPPLVLGSLARNNLYYSWATLTLLGRAVHCNVGRPALWVFPPSA